MEIGITDLSVFPLKGAQAHHPEQLFVDAGVGVRGDRCYAIRRRPGDLSTWAPKEEFFVGMNKALMAMESPSFDAGTGGGGRPHRLNQQYLNGLAARLGVDGPLTVQEADSTYNLADRSGGYVSLLNTASVNELSKYVRHHVNPARFRMNLLMQGMKPFEELEWVNGYPGTREIQIGACLFRVHNACERCRAINASLTTGMYDLALQRELAAMMRARGYESPKGKKQDVMGILLAPLNNGVIRKGDTVRMLS